MEHPHRQVMVPFHQHDRAPMDTCRHLCPRIPRACTVLALAQGLQDPVADRTVPCRTHPANATNMNQRVNRSVERMERYHEPEPNSTNMKRLANRSMPDKVRADHCHPLRHKEMRSMIALAVPMASFPWHQGISTTQPLPAVQVQDNISR